MLSPGILRGLILISHLKKIEHAEPIRLDISPYLMSKQRLAYCTHERRLKRSRFFSSQFRTFPTARRISGSHKR
jgi:hypothetical protein